MVTNGEFVSRVTNSIKSLTKDGHVSGRWILDIGKTKAKFLMAQKLDEMTLFKEDGLITYIPCVPMQRVKSKDCCVVEFRICENIMQSCETLPEGLFGKNGPSIFSVTNVDESLVYRYITPRRYVDIKKRRYRSKNSRFFTVKDGYLILLNSKSELVDVGMITLDKDKAMELSACECDKKKKKECKSKWDSEFVCPDKFLELVARETAQEVGNFNRSFIEDENPNLDENQKTKTHK